MYFFRVSSIILFTLIITLSSAAYCTCGSYSSEECEQFYDAGCPGSTCSNYGSMTKTQCKITCGGSLWACSGKNSNGKCRCYGNYASAMGDFFANTVSFKSAITSPRLIVNEQVEQDEQDFRLVGLVDPVGAGSSGSYTKYIDNILNIINAINNFDLSPSSPIDSTEFNNFLLKNYGINSNTFISKLYDLINTYVNLEKEDNEILEMIKNILNKYDPQTTNKQDEQDEQRRRLISGECSWQTLGCYAYPETLGVCPGCVTRETGCCQRGWFGVCSKNNWEVYRCSGSL